MKICVPFKYWQAALHCAAVDDIRYYLNGIHLNKNKIEATNGHVAYRATFGYWERDGVNYLNGQCGFVEQHECNGEWPDIIIGALGTKPTKSVQNKTVWLIIEKQEDSNELTIRYLDRYSKVIYLQSAEKVEGRFPDFERIIPKGKVNKEQFNIGFNPNYLALPHKLLESEGDKFSGTVVMKAWDTNSAATFELQRVARECESEVLIVMPKRI
ncbi:RusA-like Holliday junction resolvase [Vibrio phage K250 g1]